MASFNTLISPQQLFSIINDPNLVILDASIAPIGNMVIPDKQWPTVAIAHAKRFDIDNEFSDQSSPYPHTMLSTEVFTKRVQAMGICQHSKVVVYDNMGIYSSARAWWMLKSSGLAQVAILDGGLPNWVDHHLPVNAASNNNVKRGDFIAQPLGDAFCSTQDLQSMIESQNAIVIDARSAERFYGQVPEPREGLRSGHMPHAKNMPFTTLLSEGKMRPLDELNMLFSHYAQKHQKIVFTCGSGVTACVLAFAASLVGYKNLSIYDGSWAEWGANAALPAVN
ncbi:sulfurtransferase [Thalassotalea sediminis]|uniref:sulfurtransferase n=1 Tax=Thalassotalea sediminis TaxID=1759089 RepID=UPI00257455B7|nr:sulfurtransferase [Thalassotalea sediminis]